MTADHSSPRSTTPFTRRAALATISATLLTPLLPPSASALPRPTSRVVSPNSSSNVTSTSSGLRYYDFSVGSSGSPIATGDTVRFHLVTGTTGARNGWKIASTYEGDALVVVIGHGDVVPGLDEALRGMRIGGRRRALVSPDIGYSMRGGPGPLPKDFAGLQRFKNIYLNSNRTFIPDGLFLEACF